jgi:2,4-dienoyl-CoA reductase-like NADH-dependent reductase (Old Yellow Enzyme family)/thioredoxin reductase
MNFVKLFEPVAIGTMKIKNRIVMAPTGTNFPGDGSVTKKALDFYTERARGGVGLIIVEGAGIDPIYGLELPYQLNLSVNNFLPTFKQLSDAIREHGVRTSIQLFHPGCGASPLLIGKQPLSPSGVCNPMLGCIPKIMVKEDIQYIIGTFVNGAKKAKEAGFDSIQVHGGEGILHQFTSPYYNKRKDEYGSDLNGRTRLFVEVIRRIKKEMGDGFPVICRINGEDSACMITAEDSRFLAVELERAGADAIELINSSMFDCFGVPIYTNEVPRGNFAYLAEAVKKLVRIPVITNIRINDPIIAEDILVQKKADLVSMSRALIADPDLPNKAAAGKPEDINRCIACCTCIGEAFKGNHIRCAVNALTGFEQERRIKPIDRVKKVLIIGGGPGGLEAARVAALRGHQVALYEQDSRLGGQLLLAVKPPYKDEIWNLIEYLTAQVKKQGVMVTLGCEVGPDLVKLENPDAIIVATGALPSMEHVHLEEGSVVFAQDILGETVEAGSCVIIIGGGLVGAETAEFLARKDKQISIVEIRDALCMEVPPFVRDDLLRRLRELRVNVLTQVSVEKIKGNTVSLVKNGQVQNVQADTIVIAAGYRANQELAKQLAASVPELYTVGDCQEPRRILEAIHEGFMVGNII